MGEELCEMEWNNLKCNNLRILSKALLIAHARWLLVEGAFVGKRFLIPGM